MDALKPDDDSSAIRNSSDRVPGTPSPLDVDRQFEQLLRFGPTPGGSGRWERLRDPSNRPSWLPIEGEGDAAATADLAGSESPDTSAANLPTGGSAAGAMAPPLREAGGARAGGQAELPPQPQPQPQPSAARRPASAISGTAGTAGPTPLAGGGAAERTAQLQETQAKPAIDFDALADRLEKMFRSTSPGAEAWRVSLDLDPDLPQTILRVDASRTWMSLRFSTQTAEVARILSTNMPGLQEHLEDTLNMRHQISVDLG